MKITLKRLDDMYHLQATNEDGRSVEIDAAPAIGGGNKGMRPMQLMLASAGSCSSIDIISILKKQKQNLRDIVVEVNGEREKDKIPSLFTDINLHFTLFGDIDPEKAKRAVDLSVNKYCSALKTLEKTATITYSFEIQK
jgi:putative redox protein